MYFETLWHFFLENDPQFELLASNLPVHDQGRTQGEFDLIVRDQATGLTHHLELAVKFYLQSREVPFANSTTPADGAMPYQPLLSQWIGPNANDRLDLKLQRLLEHQTCLSQTDAGIRTLQSNQHSVDRCSIILKGRLFSEALPINSNKVEKPTSLNPTHCTGLWVHQSRLGEALNQLRKNEQTGTQPWILLTRRHWLGPAIAETENTKGTVEQKTKTEAKPQPAQHNLGPLTDDALIAEVNAHFKQFKQAVMVSLIAPEKNQPMEKLRLVVVPDHWPKHLRED